MSGAVHPGFQDGAWDGEPPDAPADVLADGPAAPAFHPAAVGDTAGEALAGERVMLEIPLLHHVARVAQRSAAQLAVERGCAQAVFDAFLVEQALRVVPHRPCGHGAGFAGGRAARRTPGRAGRSRREVVGRTRAPPSVWAGRSQDSVDGRPTPLLESRGFADPPRGPRGCPCRGSAGQSILRTTCIGTPVQKLESKLKDSRVASRSAEARRRRWR